MAVVYAIYPEPDNPKIILSEYKTRGTVTPDSRHLNMGSIFFSSSLSQILWTKQENFMLGNIILKVLAGYLIYMIGTDSTDSSFKMILLKILVASFFMWHITYTTPFLDWDILTHPYASGFMKFGAALSIFIAGKNIGLALAKDSWTTYLIPLALGIGIMFLI